MAIEFLPPPAVISADDRPRPEPAPREEPDSSHQDPAPAEAVSFRPLSPEEIEAEVLPDYLATGNSLPDPGVSKFIGAFRGPELLAYLCLQVKLHAQPLVIRAGHAGTLPGLVHAAEAHILETVGPQWVYLFAPAGKLSQLAAACGMQLEPWVVMSRFVAPEQDATEIQTAPKLGPSPGPTRSRIPIPEPDPGPFLDDAYQARGDDSAWEELFPGGVLQITPSGSIQ